MHRLEAPSRPGSAFHFAMDLLRKSGEFPMSYEELDDTAATVYEGIRKERSAWRRPAGERSARSRVILGSGYRHWSAGSAGAGMRALSTPRQHRARSRRS